MKVKNADTEIRVGASISAIVWITHQTVLSGYSNRDIYYQLCNI